MTSEFDLIARLAPFLANEGEGLPVGHGDDAAVVDIGGRGVAIAVDVLVEDVHFRRSMSSLEDVGWKAVTVNVSDLAAMGAVPSVAVVGLAKPASVDADDVERLYAGMHEAAQHYGLRLVGGDTVSAGALALSVTVLGEVAVDRAVRRSGAHPGDRIVVVGALGAAAAALMLVDRGLDADESVLHAHRRPEAQVAAGLALAEAGATAMIDVSDGFGADLGHVVTASSQQGAAVGALVEADSLPFGAGLVEAADVLGVDPLDLAVAGGDDYALIATVPLSALERVLAETGATVVGEIVAGAGVTLRYGDGRSVDITGRGWDHFPSSGGESAGASG